MTPFNGPEEQLPQRLQGPALLRRSVGDNVNKRRDAYHRRKAQEKETRARARARQYKREEAMGSWERRTDGRIDSLSGAVSEASISTLPVPEEGTYYTWDSNDPSTIATLVDHRGRTTRPHALVNPAPAPAAALQPPQPPSSGAPEQLRTNAPDYGDQVYLHFPYKASAASSSTQQPSSIVHTSGTNISSTTDDLQLETGHKSFLTHLSKSSVPTEDRGESPALPPSALTPPSELEPTHSTAQGLGSWWCNDRFFAVYQDFFIRRGSDHGVSSHPSPASTHIEYRVPLDLTNGRPTAQAYLSTAPVSEDTTVHHDTAERYPLECPRTSSSDYATPSEGSDYLDWSIPPVVFEPIDPQRLKELEVAAAAAAGYADTLYLQAILPSTLPEAVYADMHPSPPTIRTSHSEFPHANKCATHGFAANFAQSYTQSWATTGRKASQGPHPQRALPMRQQAAASRYFNVA
ncbi:hypothetical protein GSI_13159 [Ganoderma sinense ZZ0214-1]|uniref:Uncharacterized protein n=1 Tax=Ganoderma sinense ZZ0214-1 TaxID=1077348 RepID=A0A2G8RUS9_9APHY|nr:hypothetical protein GSI_13159 [Ganoderma sinense ZZ0214-1]